MTFESKYIVQEIAKKYQRKGLYLNEIIDNFKNLNNEILNYQQKTNSDKEEENSNESR